MVTKFVERHWFDTRLLQTDILQKIKENSLPTAWKQLSYVITEKFNDFPELHEIRIPLKDLKAFYLPNTRYDEPYLERLLKERGYERKAMERGYFPIAAAIDSDFGTAHTQKYAGRPFVFPRNQFVKTEVKTVSDLPF